MSVEKEEKPIWNEILAQLQEDKNLFDKSYKCLNKSNLPSRRTRHKHLNLLTIHHNHIVATAKNLRHLLSDSNSKQVEELISSVKSRLQSILLKLNCVDKVPSSLDETFAFELGEDSEEDYPASENYSVSVDTSFNEHKMTDQIKFIELACKILPEFDGTIENLQRFIDALQLIDTLKGTNEDVAISLIKTKLVGIARNYITKESTIEQVINKLRSSIKGESAGLITNRLLNTKQLNKTPTDYAKEIEQLAKALNNAYLADGLGPETASKYSTQIAVQSMAKNANSEKIKLIMEVGKFDNISEATTKFTSVANDNASSQQIFYVRARNNEYRFNRYGYRNRNNFSNTSNNNASNTRQTRNYHIPNRNISSFRNNHYINRQLQHSNRQPQHSNRQSQYSNRQSLPNNGRSSSNNVRVLEQDSEN